MRYQAVRTAGFTLIELLVVIAIIAILAAILFPVFARAKNKAESASCLSNCKQIALSLLMYCQDWDDRAPIYIDIPQGYESSLMPYMKNEEMLYCPSETQTVVAGTLSPPSAGSLYFGYVSNNIYWWDSPPGVYGPVFAWAGQSLDSFPYPTHFIPFAEGSSSPGRYHTEVRGGVTYYVYDGAVTGASELLDVDPPCFGCVPANPTNGILGRHNGGANCMFLDGHAKLMFIRQLWNNGNYPYYFDHSLTGGQSAP